MFHVKVPTRTANTRTLSGETTLATLHAERVRQLFKASTKRIVILYNGVPFSETQYGGPVLLVFRIANIDLEGQAR